MNKKDISEERCECGKLLLRRTRRGFEFKCNRCKRIYLIPFERVGGNFQSLCPVIKCIENGSPEDLNHKPSALNQKESDHH